jgi:predicted PurR-regulated permease PerM
LERPSATFHDLIASASQSWLLRAVALLALLALARHASPVLVPLACALILALVLVTPFEWLRCRGVPAGVAAAACIGSVVGVGVIACLPILGGANGVSGAGGLGAAPSIGQVAGIDSTWQLQLQRLGAHESALGGLARLLGAQLGRLRAAEIETTLGNAIVHGLLTLAAAAIMAFFVLLAQRSLWAAAARALPHRRSRLRCLGALREARRGAANYVAVMSLMNLALGAATGVVLALLGLPGAGVWGVVTGLLAFIPYVGPAAITVLLLAAGSSNFTAPWAVAAPMLSFLVLHGLEANFISPWLLGRQLRISRVAILVAVLLGTWTFGLIGGALAIPALLVARAIVRRTPGHALAKALLEPERSAAAPLAQTLRDALRSPRAHRDGRAALPAAGHRIDAARPVVLRPPHGAGAETAPAAAVEDRPAQGTPFAQPSAKRGRHD